MGLGLVLHGARRLFVSAELESAGEPWRRSRPRSERREIVLVRYYALGM